MAEKVLLCKAALVVLEWALVVLSNSGLELMAGQATVFYHSLLVQMVVQEMASYYILQALKAGLEIVVYHSRLELKGFSHSLPQVPRRRIDQDDPLEDSH